MRRKDREITDRGEIIDILRKSEVLRLALVDGNLPYIVPMNFGLVENGGELEIYLHCAKVGKKLDIIRLNNNVAFETDTGTEIVREKLAEDWTSYYASVVGFGKAFLVQEHKDKITGLDAIMSKYGYNGKPEYSDAVLTAVQIIKIEVTSIFGKANLPKD